MKIQEKPHRRVNIQINIVTGALHISKIDLPAPRVPRGRHKSLTIFYGGSQIFLNLKNKVQSGCPSKVSVYYRIALCQ